MPVLTATLRVKNEAGHLPRCLENISQICDHIVAYDDGSTDGTLEILKSHPKVRHVVSFEKDFYHETMDRSVSLALAALTEPDWILRIDPDEILEDRAIRQIPRLMEMKDYKAWCFKRFNCIGDEEHGDLEVWHWCLYRYVPGKVFYYNIKFHRAFPNIDKVPGKWGVTDLRVKHFGYMDTIKKREKAKKDGYFFGDYLNPYFTWEEYPDDFLLVNEIQRPPYFPFSQQQAGAMQVGEGPAHQRFPGMDEPEIALALAEEILNLLGPAEGYQAVRWAKELTGDHPGTVLRMRILQAEALHAYLLGDFENARRLFEEIKSGEETVWPFMVYMAKHYLDQIDRMETQKIKGVWNPGLYRFHDLKESYLNWFLDRLEEKKPEKIHLYGAGKHSLDLDDTGFFNRFEVQGIVDDKPKSRAVNRIPVVTLEQAISQGAGILLISTDMYEKDILQRLKKEDLGNLKLQPVYWSLGEEAFWFDERGDK